jgi:flagellar FliJ protein
MPYTFKLEALRKFREFEEERVQKEFSAAQRHRDEAARHIAERIALRDDTEREFAEKQDGSAVSHASMYRDFLQRLAGEIEVLQQKLMVAEKKCEKKRQALLEAMKRRKAMDRLKEKGEQDYLEEQSRDEGKFIDEIAINRFMLKRR